MLNWGKAEQYLAEIESEYASIGPAGYLGLKYTIRPLRDKFNKGERTQELYDEIMELE